jgi:uncharacterized protein (TIGR02246 family)
VAPTTTPDPVRRLFQRYADTFATHDVEAIVALHAPDTQFWLHLDKEPVRGRAAVADAFAGFFEQWPKLGFEVHRVVTGSDHWVLDWALTAELHRSDGTPAPVRFDCVDIVTLDEEGLVVRKDTFVDYVQIERALAGAAGP